MVTAVALMLAAQAGPTPAPEKPQLICRKGTQETGSRIRTGRRCKTAEEWARDDEERARVSPSARITEGQGDAMTKSTQPH